MTNKAYIVVNKQQEREVLEQLEREGMVWDIINEKPTDFNPRTSYLVSFPYVIFVNDWLSWNWLPYLENEEIVFDGRKEEHMSDKYVVSQEFMNSLNKWRDILSDFSMSENFVGPTAIEELDDIVDGWWNITDLSGEEQNSRLIAILNWVNGEDVFEVEKPKKWVIKSKVPDEDGCYWYVSFTSISPDFCVADNDILLEGATRFDTKEEAESWANAHQEVVKVD